MFGYYVGLNALSGALQAREDTGTDACAGIRHTTGAQC